MTVTKTMRTVRSNRTRRDSTGKFISAEVRCPKCNCQCRCGPSFKRVAYYYCRNCRTGVKVDRVIRVTSAD